METGLAARAGGGSPTSGARSLPGAWASLGRRGLGLLAATYLAACLLPSEPSDADLIQLRWAFDAPLRIPVRGPVRPVIVATRGGAEMRQAPAYRLVPDDPSVVQVDSSGRRLWGVSRGSTSVRVVVATAMGTRDTTFPVQVVVSGVRVLSHDTAFGHYTNHASLPRLGQTYQFQGVAVDAVNDEIPDVPLTWSTADSLVARITGPGLVTAVGEGHTQVDAEADGVRGTGFLAVTQNASALVLSPDCDTLRTVGRTISYLALVLDSTNQVIDGARPHWLSTDTAVARISPLGVATAVGSGTARIIARVGDAADTATLVVAQVVRFLFVSPGSRTITALADTARFTAQARDSGGAPVAAFIVAWAVADSSVVTVDAAGVVIARGDGVASLVARVGGQSAFAEVAVRRVPASGQIVQDSLALTGEGATGQFQVQGVDRNGYVIPSADPAAFTWRSRLGLVATVGPTGLVTAHQDGATWVQAFTDTSRAARDSALVTVSGAPHDLITFSSERGIEVVRPDGSSRALLVPMATGSAWSPDGARLAFERRVDSYADIYTSWADGSDTVDVTGHVGSNLVPAWSPDGSRIAFFSNRLSPGGIWIANADGSNATLLRGPVQSGQDLYAPTNPSWSPDGSKVAFDQACNVAVVSIDGSGLLVLTAAVGGCNQAPAWSPDGSQLAFVNQGTDGIRHLWLIGAHGSGAVDLSQASRATTPSDGTKPAWSSSGSQIVFGAAPMLTCYDDDFYPYPCPEPSHLWVVNRDGTGLSRLTQGAWESRPAWRPASPLRAPQPASERRP